MKIYPDGRTTEEVEDGLHLYITKMAGNGGTLICLQIGETHVHMTEPQATALGHLLLRAGGMSLVVHQGSPPEDVERLKAMCEKMSTGVKPS